MNSSPELASQPKLRIGRAEVALALLAALSLGAYLLGSHLFYRLGFPLDDAWIHQTYARNLGLRGEWSFIPGRPSAGSTAPLWSVLLALGYLLRLGPLLWSSLLGWISLLALALVGRWALRLALPERAAWAGWLAVLLILDWRLIWAAGSGMETLLFALLVLLVLALLLTERPRWLTIGLLIGLSVWVRPDGLTLLGPAGLALLGREPSWQARGRAGVKLLVGVLALFLPYLLFNLLLAGSVWPNTFFAKQAEYASHRQFPFFQRLLAQGGAFLVGVEALLLPGFLLAAAQALRKRHWAALGGILWVAGYLVLYAWRLPVTYQHGRYQMPALPAYLFFAFWGMAAWLQPQALSTLRRVLAKAWALSAALVLLAFWALGLRSFAQDVAIIETEMVGTARWVAQNTPPDALVAAHDIGALGYFGGRDLLDLAGLVSPEVIPFLRDEARLAEFLDEKQADYLVTFPDWYPLLVLGLQPVYQSEATVSPQAGGANMAVYAWPRPRGVSQKP